jgi:drug/metabolite transporter (DMT)-like permease
MHVRTRRLALTEGMIAGVLFGTAAVLIRLLQNMDAFSIALWRLIIACVVLTIALVLIKKSSNLSLIGKNLKDLLILSVFLGLHFIFFISAVKDTTILNATVLVNTTPIFSMFVSSFIFKLKPSRVAFWGLAISFVGVCVIAYAETLSPQEATTGVSSLSSLKGDLEAVLAALVESFYLSYGRKLRSQMDILSIMAPMYLLTAIVVGILSVPVTRGILVLPASSEAILAIFGLGILPTAMAHTLYFSSLSNLKSFETATLALLEPIGATILGISVFQEIPAPLFALGAALVLVGIVFVIKNTG